MTLATSAMTTASTGSDFAHTAAATKATMMVDPALALQRADEAERLAFRFRSGWQRDEATAVALWLKGEAYVRLDRTDRAAPLLAQALVVARHQVPGTKLEADILLSSGGLHADRGEPAAAFTDYRAAHQIFQKIGDLRHQAVVLLCISSLYFDANDYRSALKYLDQAMAVGRSDSNLMLSIYNNRATYLLELGRFAEAEAGDRKALAIAREMNSPLLELRILGNIARVRLKLNDVGGAERILRDAQRLAQSDGSAVWRLQ